VQKKVVKETVEVFKTTDTMGKTTITASAQMIPLKINSIFMKKSRLIITN
jgi:hypothetical protein